MLMMRVVVGVTGASGVEMALTLLEAIRAANRHEIHLIASDAAKVNWSLETALPWSTLLNLADFVHDPHNFAASVASGSFSTAGMIVMPCSMKTLAGIVTGYSDNLILRAADVCLKENRRVILVPREMPLGKLHLRNLCRAADLGCTIIPPMLTFYNNGRSLEQQVQHVVGKVLMQLGIKPDFFRPWRGEDSFTLAKFGKQ